MFLGRTGFLIVLQNAWRTVEVAASYILLLVASLLLLVRHLLLLAMHLLLLARHLLLLAASAASYVDVWGTTSKSPWMAAPPMQLQVSREDENASWRSESLPYEVIKQAPSRKPAWLLAIVTVQTKHLVMKSKTSHFLERAFLWQGPTSMTEGLSKLFLSDIENT